MSAELLNRVKQHIVDGAGLLTGYTLRYYRWSDEDLNGSGNVALFRMTGTSGQTNHEAQQHDVSLFLLVGPKDVRRADDDMRAVVQYLRSEAGYTNGADVFAFHPLQSYTGPTYLQNGRALFEILIRCGVEDE